MINIIWYENSIYQKIFFIPLSASYAGAERGIFMRLDVLAREFIFDCQVRNLAPRTVKNYERSSLIFHSNSCCAACPFVLLLTCHTNFILFLHTLGMCFYLPVKTHSPLDVPLCEGQKFVWQRTGLCVFRAWSRSRPRTFFVERRQIMGEYMGTKEASEKWGYRQETIRKWISMGLIPKAEQDKKGSPWRMPADTPCPKPIKNKK